MLALKGFPRVPGGFWAGYWYNGHIYGPEIGRGLDIFELKPSEFLSQNEIDAANLVHFDVVNPQNQRKQKWPASFIVARAYLDQLVRDHGLSAERASSVRTELGAAEQLSGQPQRAALTRLAAQLVRDAKSATDAGRVRLMAAAVKDLAANR